ncbi:MAG: RecX family transcriptional regulator [Acidobacteriota bacterium]|nr:RecX family transcriptional regulator [Acidobacteriota bacterium]
MAEGDLAPQEERGPRQAYRKAIQLLARRPHFVREIRRKLSDRGFDDEECNHAIARLESEGMLGDFEAALGFISSRLRRGPIGRRRMRAELARRGADRDAVEQALREGMPASERESALDAARRWAGKGGRNRDALMRHLDRLGFRSRDIVEAAGELSSVDENPFDGGA